MGANMRMILTITGAILLVLGSGGALPAAQQDPAELGTRLLQQAPVRVAVEFARSDESRTIAEQIEICEVPAPPFQEQVRAELYARKFRELGLRNVRIDQEGNVLGERPGRAAAPHLV